MGKTNDVTGAGQKGHMMLINGTIIFNSLSIRKSSGSLTIKLQAVYMLVIQLNYPMSELMVVCFADELTYYSSLFLLLCIYGCFDHLPQGITCIT